MVTLDRGVHHTRTDRLDRHPTRLHGPYGPIGSDARSVPSGQGRGEYLDMARRLHKFSCPGCGRHTERMLSTTQKERCIDCSMGDTIAGIQQMQSKSGPAWEAWLLSNGANGRPPNRPKE